MKMFQPEQPTIIFLHIPKAAGATLQSIISRHYKNSQVFYYDFPESINEFKSFSPKTKQQIKLITGHLYFGFHQYCLPPYTYITMLRNPVNRVISHYYYARRTPNHYLYQKIKSGNLSLKDYLKSNILELNNGQVRFLSGQNGFENHVEFGKCTREMLDEAKQRLTTYFSFIGITERFNESIISLQEAFGFNNCFYYQKNVTKQKLAKSAVDKEILDAIVEINKLDIELYDYANKIFQKKLDTIENFDKKLHHFNAKNKLLLPALKLYDYPKYLYAKTRNKF